MKTILSIVIGLLICSNAFAYDFGYIKVDPNVSMQKMSSSPWYANKKPIFLGDKPEAALIWNKKDATHGIVQLGIDTSGEKVFIVGPKSMTGMSLTGVPLTAEATSITAAFDATKMALIAATTNAAALTSIGLPLHVVSSGELVIESHTNMDVNIGTGLDITALSGMDFTASVEEGFEFHGGAVSFDLMELVQADLGNTCMVGELKIDTGGITTELCYCVSSNTWKCALMGDLLD